jgi:hypothetical protein
MLVYTNKSVVNHFIVLFAVSGCSGTPQLDWVGAMAPGV